MEVTKELLELEDKMEKIYLGISVAEGTTKAVWLANQEGLNRTLIDSALLGIGDNMENMKEDMNKLIEVVVRIRRQLR